MASKRIGHVWFNGRESLGIILVKDEFSPKLKSYFGTVSGNNQEEDLERLYQTGTKFPVKEAISIIKEYGKIEVPSEVFEKYIIINSFDEDIKISECPDSLKNAILTLSINKLRKLGHKLNEDEDILHWNNVLESELKISNEKAAIEWFSNHSVKSQNEICNKYGTFRDEVNNNEILLMYLRSEIITEDK